MSPPDYAQPTPGRIVMYMLDEFGRVRPAIVVRVTDEGLNLQVFLDGPSDEQCLLATERRQDLDEPTRSAVRRAGVLFDATKKRGTWHWPARV